MEIAMRQIKRRNWPYTFDYSDQKFLEYFRIITGIGVGLELKRTLSRFLLINPAADGWLRTSKNFKYIKSKEMIPFGEERESVIKWHIILRDRLQKEWNKYKNTTRTIKRRVK
jgi:hypothetical protein